MPVVLADIQFGPFAIEHPEIIVSSIVGWIIMGWLIARFAAPPIKTALDERAAKIADNKRQVELALAETRAQRDDYASRIDRFEQESRERIDAAVREAEVARDEIVADARRSAEALRRRSEEELAREQTRQRIRLRRQIVQMTLDAAEQSMQAHSTEVVQRQLIGDFITQVAISPGASKPGVAPIISTMQPPQPQRRGGA